MDHTRILIIEDEREIASLLGYNLETFGYRTRLAGDAREGLETFLSFNPDLILLDIHLPDRDGWSVLKEIRQHDTLSHPLRPRPVIILSAKEDPDKMAFEGAHAQVSAFLAKPYLLDELLEAIERALQVKQKQAF